MCYSLGAFILALTSLDVCMYLYILNMFGFMINSDIIVNIVNNLKSNNLSKQKSLFKHNLLTWFTTGLWTDLKGLARSYHELCCKKKKR